MSEEISREEIAALLARGEEMTREELRDYVEEQRSRNNIPYHVYSALIDGIDTLEQEPKTGHWEWTDGDERIMKASFYTTWTCTSCGCKRQEKTKYCPNCGAKMESEEQDEI